MSYFLVYYNAVMACYKVILEIAQASSTNYSKGLKINNNNNNNNVLYH